LQTSVRDGRQLCLFEDLETATQLDQVLWHRSFDQQPSSLHRLCSFKSPTSAPLVQTLIDLYSQPGEVVLDPFAGSGVIPFEAALSGRTAEAIDLNPCAYLVSQGKLTAPCSLRQALQQADQLLIQVEAKAASVDLNQIPVWVQDFFHPQTLQEIVAAFQQLYEQPNAFLSACLLGILHHVLPGFLSYPTQPDAPYLKRASFPPDQFPHLYTYRDVRSRLMTKIRRVYRQHQLPHHWNDRQYRVQQGSATHLAIADSSVDTILSSPPHPGAFDNLRRSQLRLWFLGYPHWQTLQAALIANQQAYRTQMPLCLQEMARVLKPGGYCILLLTELVHQGQTEGLAEQLVEMAVGSTNHQFSLETLYDRALPGSQRSAFCQRPLKVQRLVILKREKTKYQPAA